MPNKYILHKNDSICDIDIYTEASTHHVYLIITTVADWSEPKDKNAKFDKNDYYAHPEKYDNTFYQKVSHVTCPIFITYSL